MPSFEEKGMAKAAARRAAREAKRLGKDAGKVAGGVSKLAGKGLFKLIIMNPYIGLALLCILAAFIIYTVYSVNSTLDKLLYQYTHLVDTSQQNSKAQFDKKLHYIKVNSDGTTTVVIGLKSEIDAQQLQQSMEDAGGTDGGGKIEIDGPVTSVKDANISTKGSAINGIKIGGLSVYDGIPAVWSASSDSKYIDFSETAEAWNKGYEEAFGHAYPNTISVGTIHTDNALNKYSPAKNLTQDGNGFIKDGITCMGFAPSTYFGSLVLSYGGTGDPAVTYNYKYCIVLKDSNDNYVYMPAIPSDVKIHTWPGGVTQTYIRHKNDSDKYDLCVTAENQPSVTTADEALKELEGGTAGKSFGTSKSTQVQMNLEVYKIAEDLKKSAYTPVGIIRVE